MRTHVLVAVVVAVAGCSSSGVEADGAIQVCFAAASDGSEFAISRDESRTGLRPVADDALTSPPEAFTSCAADIGPQAEFIDDTDEHIWLAIRAIEGGRDLVRSAHFALVDDGNLRLLLHGGFTPSSSLFLGNGDQPIVALQSSGAPGAIDLGVLDVDNGGGTALPGFGPCGSFTDLAVRFTDDDGDHTAAIGESQQLIVGETEFLGTNVASRSFGETSCEDTFGKGDFLTWVAADNSL